MGGITLTLDVEDHAPGGQDPRLEFATRRVLDFFDHLGATATIFVVGEVARRHAELVAECASRGHEVALHGWRHVPLTELSPQTFEKHLELGRRVIAEITGTPPEGFRAPTCSLVPGSYFAQQVLAEAGFRWSSSVLPAKNPLYGWPGAPNKPFRWPSGIVEVPAPVWGWRTAALPFLGGVYFRLLPTVLVELALRTCTHDVPFVYCHPYDFDHEEPFWVVPEVGKLGSRLLWLGRKKAFRKLERVVSKTGAARPLGERIRYLDVESLEVFPR